jgi:archaellin
MTVSGVNSDGDSLLETGEKFKVVIDFTDLAIDGVDPAVTATNRPDLYAHPYEELRIELRPSAGSVLTVER